MILFKKLARAIDGGNKRQILHYLNSLPADKLDTFGYSSALLEQGIKAWPWREDNQSSEIVKVEGLIAEEERCVNELQSYSDAELLDLGIARGRIKSSVRHGRPGIDEPVIDRAA